MVRVYYISGYFHGYKIPI